MLPRIHRLTSEKDILATIKKGRRIRTKYALVYVRENPDSRTSRLACVAGKKVSLLAVKRHLYQRWLRETGRSVLKQFPGGFDMVWVATADIKKATFSDVDTEIQASLQNYFVT